ncbi:helix-turn-helix transcriptional regulator [Enterococcus sp. BWM-S5]|uniref:Helix-turn-helix transcriptional regulator n=1 Tax=Enterococcus larvae TaxID=2794352 RepID=A0ABS4CNI1_9ENTE|nr:helix-turn-helix transcriptional regulator [Enterococcus larvae]MBP1047542.1 helix-turn-helix transcriptional regulator [Enterococcus larvae]
MNIGETLKFIRKSKRHTQREISKGYLDRTTYSRIESDERSVRLNDLQSVLNKMSVNVHEFFSFAMFDLDQQQFRELFKHCGEHLKDEKTKKQLIAYYKKLAVKPTKDLRELSNQLAIKNYFHDHWEEIPSISESDSELIYRMLVKKDYYFQYDYILLANLIPYFTEKQADLLIKKAIPVKDEEKRDELTRNSAFNALLNLIHVRLFEGKLMLVKKYLKLAKKQQSALRNSSYKLDLYYFDCLFKFLLTKDPKAFEKTQLFIKVTEDIGEQDKAELMRRELALLTEKGEEDSSNESKSSFPIYLIKEG